MYKNLSPGAVGIGGSTEELTTLAATHGFGGLDLNAGEAAARVAASLDTILSQAGLHEPASDDSP